MRVKWLQGSPTGTRFLRVGRTAKRYRAVLLATFAEPRTEADESGLEPSNPPSPTGYGEAPTLSTLIVKEMDETYSWARLGAQLYFGWFALMLTINGVGVGWLFQYGNSKPGIARLIFGIFIVLDLMGTIATFYIRRHMLHCDERIKELIRGMPRPGVARLESFRVQSAIPPMVFVNTTYGFAGMSLFILIIFWLVLEIWPRLLDTPA